MLAGIVVLGCHRSGTSLIADIIRHWGAYVGGDLLSPDEFNPHGYWEYRPLVELNDELLRTVDSTWHLPPEGAAYSRLESLAAEDIYCERALELLQRMQGTDRPWLWKDPRLCVLLPFWKKIWGDVVYVVPVRDPSEVAESVRLRDEFSRSAGLLLWHRYMSLVVSDEDVTRNALFCSYSELLSDPTAGCVRICDFLDGRFGLDRSKAVARVASMAKAIVPKLCHNRSEIPFCHNPVATPAQKELYCVLQSLATGAFAPTLPLSAEPGWREGLMAEAREVLRRQQSQSHFQVYWKGPSTHWCEQNSRRTKMRPEKWRQSVRVTLPPDPEGGLISLRLDLGEHEGLISIHELTVEDSHGEPVWTWDHRPVSIEALPRHQLSLFNEEAPDLDCMLRLEGTDPWMELTLDARQAGALQSGGAVDLEFTFFSLPALFARALEWNSEIQRTRQLIAQIASAWGAAEERLRACESQTKAAAVRMSLWEEVCIARISTSEAQTEVLRLEQSRMSATFDQSKARVEACESEWRAATAYMRLLDHRSQTTFDAVQSILLSKTWTTLRSLGSILLRLGGRSPQKERDSM